MKKAWIIAVALLFVASGNLSAREVTVDAERDSQLMDAGCGGNSNKGHGGKFYWSIGQDVTSEDTALYEWDLSGITLGPGEYVASCDLQIYSSGDGNNFACTLNLHPMLKTWGEGVGVPTDGFGGTGYPWGPTSVGDSCKNYQIVQTVGLGTGNFAAETVATGGVPWAGPGATGATDCDLTKEMATADQWIAASVGDKAAFAPIPLSAVGCGVVEDWIDGSLGNLGLVMVLTNHRVGGSSIHLATREYTCANVGACPGAYAPELVIEIVPEPATMLLLAGGACLTLLRKRR